MNDELNPKKINDPLQIILGNIHLIKNNSDETEKKIKFLEAIDEAVDKITQISDKLPNLKDKLSDSLLVIKGATYLIRTNPEKTPETLNIIKNAVNKITQILKSTDDELSS
jgi:hypothetical protein